MSRAALRRCPTKMKHAYRTRARALMAAAHTAKDGKTEGRQLYVYKCPGCRMWHLTHRERRA